PCAESLAPRQRSTPASQAERSAGRAIASALSNSGGRPSRRGLARTPMLLKRAGERAYRSNCARRPEVGDRFSPDLCKRLLAEEYEKLCNAGNRDVHDTSKNTTLLAHGRSSKPT